MTSSDPSQRIMIDTKRAAEAFSRWERKDTKGLKEDEFEGELRKLLEISPKRAAADKSYLIGNAQTFKNWAAGARAKPKYISWELLLAFYSLAEADISVDQILSFVPVNLAPALVDLRGCVAEASSNEPNPDGSLTYRLRIGSVEFSRQSKKTFRPDGTEFGVATIGLLDAAIRILSDNEIRNRLGVLGSDQSGSDPEKDTIRGEVLAVRLMDRPDGSGWRVERRIKDEMLKGWVRSVFFAESEVEETAHFVFEVTVLERKCIDVVFSDPDLCHDEKARQKEDLRAGILRQRSMDRGEVRLSFQKVVAG